MRSRQAHDAGVYSAEGGGCVKHEAWFWSRWDAGGKCRKGWGGVGGADGMVLEQEGRRGGSSVVLELKNQVGCLGS